MSLTPRLNSSVSGRIITGSSELVTSESFRNAQWSATRCAVSVMESVK